MFNKPYIGSHSPVDHRAPLYLYLANSVVTVYHYTPIARLVGAAVPEVYYSIDSRTNIINLAGDVIAEQCDTGNLVLGANCDAGKDWHCD